MQALERAGGDPAVKAIVVTGEGGTFAAGADINEVSSGLVLKSPITREVQARMEAASKPLVAAIEGVALGGGFELALACHWRIAATTAKVGLPEVKLGLLPGAGGTQRFMHLAGPEAALEAITAGHQIPAPRALELGLVDALADPALDGALAFARRAVAERRPLRVTSDVGERIRGVDPELSAAFRRKLEAMARGQLAPFRIVDCIEAACTLAKEAAFARERESFIECRDSPQRKALVHLFFAEREARRIPGLGPEVTALPVHRAAVVGAGTMGGGIAMTLANAGIPVSLLELSAQALERGLGVVGKSYDASVARGSLTRSQADAALGLIRGVSEYPALAGADIVIEAVYEDLEVKQEVFWRLDRVVAPHAILATNTSTLDIDAIAASTSAGEGRGHPFLQSRERHEAARERARAAHLAGDSRHRHGAREEARQDRGARRQLRRLHRQPHAHVLRSGGGVPPRGRSDARADRPGHRGVRLCDGAARGAGPGRERRRLSDPQGPQAPARRALVADPRAARRRRQARPEGGPRLLPLRRPHAHPRPRGGRAHRAGFARARHRAAQHPRRGDSRAAAASAGERGRAHRGGGHCAAGERHRYRVRQRLRLPRLAGRSDVLGRRGRPRARDRDHEAARAAPRRALASRSAPRASGSIGPGLEQRARLKQLPRRGNSMHRLLWVALLGSAAAVSYMARAEASAPDHQALPLPATVADWARGAQLFDGLGRYHRAVTTSSAAAQQYFDQGMRLLWAFNHDEATRSFAKAAQLDPS